MEANLSTHQQTSWRSTPGTNMGMVQVFMIILQKIFRPVRRDWVTNYTFVAGSPKESPVGIVVHLVEKDWERDLRITGKNNRFPILNILGYLMNTHKNPKFGKVRQVPTREFPTKFPDWDLSHSSKFGIFVGILQIP